MKGIYNLINLYVVESPLQALCALEISLNKRNEKNYILARISSGNRTRNDNQILEIISKGTWYHHKNIKYRFYSNALTNNFESRFFLSKIEKELKNKVSSLYIGDFRSPFMHMVRVAVEPSQVFLLDDGAVTVKIINSYINKGYYYPYNSFYPENKFKKMAFKLIYGKYIDFKIMNEHIKILTAFSRNEDFQSEKLLFSNIKSLFKQKYSMDDCLVYYYGSKYSEAGIVALDYELRFLKSVKNFYDIRSKTVIYFAHRDESEKKLDYISKKLNFEVVIPNTMAELYLLESKVLPSEISGAYTSILNNAKVIFPEIFLRSFKLRSKEIGQKWRKDIELIYEYYRQIDITIEDESIKPLAKAPFH